MAEVIIINQEEMIKPCNENKNDHYDVISDIISDVIDDVINGVVNKKEEINENEIEKDKYERVFVENVNLRSLLEESQSTLTTFLIENERINGLLKEKKDLLNFQLVHLYLVIDILILIDIIPCVHIIDY